MNLLVCFWLMRIRSIQPGRVQLKSHNTSSPRNVEVSSSRRAVNSTTRLLRGRIKGNTGWKEALRLRICASSEDCFGLHSASRESADDNRGKAPECIGREKKEKERSCTERAIPRTTGKTRNRRNGKKEEIEGGKKKRKTYDEAPKRPVAVCVTVPHRALTAPRRVASL